MKQWGSEKCNVVEVYPLKMIARLWKRAEIKWLEFVYFLKDSGSIHKWQSSLNPKWPFTFLSSGDSINLGAHYTSELAHGLPRMGRQNNCKTHDSQISYLDFFQIYFYHTSMGRCQSEHSVTISGSLIIKLHASNHRHSQVLQIKIKSVRWSLFREVISAVPFSDQERQVFNQQSTLQSLELV